MAKYEGRHRNALPDEPTHTTSTTPTPTAAAVQPRVTPPAAPTPRMAPTPRVAALPTSRMAPPAPARATAPAQAWASAPAAARPAPPAPPRVAAPAEDWASLPTSPWDTVSARDAVTTAPRSAPPRAADLESRVRSRADGRSEARPDGRAQARGETRALTRSETRALTRTESRAQSRSVGRRGAVPETQAPNRRDGHPGVPTPPVRATASTPTAAASSAASGAPSDVPATRRARRASAPRRNVRRPILAGGLTVGLGLGALGYAAAAGNLGSDDAAFVVGDGVVAQTDELARAMTVDTTYRAAASVSRNERRTAIAASGLRDAKALEAKQRAEAERKAREAREAAQRAELEAMRKKAIANARSNPQAAARVLMADYGWTSDAQYNCLVNLWNGESGWRWNAENAGSGAYGIPQSLPASKMSKFGSDYRTNPITQIKWGLWYIDASYGNPCNAWSTWLARSPHWY